MAFNGCKNLRTVYFKGDNPLYVPHTFDSCSSELKLYYRSGTKGWSTPHWNGIPTEMYH